MQEIHQRVLPTANPIIPWIGGKRRLARKILPMFPAHDCYVEPFAGGAALFFLKDQSDVEVLNDINGELVNLYRVVKHHLEEFIRQFKYALISRQIYCWLKQTPEETLTDIQRAARFYYLQKMAFGGKVSNQTFGTATTSAPRMNLLRIEEELSAAPPAPIQNLRRALALGGMHPALRPSPLAFLPRPAVLGHRGLRRGLRARAVLPDSRSG